jgi:hypothetical protein
MASDHLTTNDVLTLIDREVSSWPGVSKGPGRFGSTAYSVGRREIGHIHRNDVADFGLPRTIRDELLATGRAAPHQAGVRGAVSYAIRAPSDVGPALALFRLNYDRLRNAGVRAAGETAQDDEPGKQG